jgi:hypothetical protein
LKPPQCHTPVSFRAHYEVQIGLLRTRIAISRGYGDFANDSLDNRDLLHPITFTNFYNSIHLLNRQRFYPLFESVSRLAVDFSSDQRMTCAVVPWDCPRRPCGSDVQSEGSDAEFLPRGSPN